MLKRTIEIILIVAIVVVVVFISVRIFSYKRAMSTQVHFDAPNQKNVTVTIPGRPHFIRDYVDDPESVARRVTFHFSTNSEGLRGAEFPVHKPPGTFRILVVGECVAFGNGVEDDQTYAAQLQRLVHDTFPDRTIEVVNAGLNASPPQRILDRLRQRFVEYEPDLVFFGPGANTVFIPCHVDTRVPCRIMLSDQEYEEEMSRYERVLEDVLGVAEAHHFRLVLVTPTCNTFFIPDGMMYVDMVRRFATSHGIPLLDTTEIVREAERKDGLEIVNLEGEQQLVSYHEGTPTVILEVPFKSDNTRYIAPEIYRYLDEHPDVELAVGIDENHPNARGHRLIAEAALRVITEYHLLDPY